MKRKRYKRFLEKKFYKINISIEALDYVLKSFQFELYSNTVGY